MSFLTEYMIDGNLYPEREVCLHCLDVKTKEPKLCDVRYSFGFYAGKYCDACWKTSGYRDATDPEAKFSEMDAGERLEDDY